MMMTHTFLADEEDVGFFNLLTLGEKETAGQFSY